MVYFVEAYRTFELRLEMELKHIPPDVISKIHSIIENYDAEIFFEDNKCFIKLSKTTSFNMITNEIIEQLTIMGYR